MSCLLAVQTSYRSSNVLPAWRLTSQTQYTLLLRKLIGLLSSTRVRIGEYIVAGRPAAPQRGGRCDVAAVGPARGRAAPRASARGQPVKPASTRGGPPRGALDAGILP